MDHLPQGEFTFRRFLVTVWSMLGWPAKVCAVALVVMAVTNVLSLTLGLSRWRHAWSTQVIHWVGVAVGVYAAGFMIYALRRRWSGRRGEERG